MVRGQIGLQSWSSFVLKKKNKLMGPVWSTLWSDGGRWPPFCAKRSISEAFDVVGIIGHETTALCSTKDPPAQLVVSRPRQPIMKLVSSKIDHEAAVAQSGL